MDQLEKSEDRYIESFSSDKMHWLLTLEWNIIQEGKCNPRMLFGFALKNRIINMKIVNIKVGEEINDLAKSKNYIRILHKQKLNKNIRSG